LKTNYYLCFERIFKNLKKMANLSEFEPLKNIFKTMLKSDFKALS